MNAEINVCTTIRGINIIKIPVVNGRKAILFLQTCYLNFTKSTGFEPGLIMSDNPDMGDSRDLVSCLPGGLSLIYVV